MYTLPNDAWGGLEHPYRCITPTFLSRLPLESKPKRQSFLSHVHRDQTVVLEGTANSERDGCEGIILHSQTQPRSNVLHSIVHFLTAAYYSSVRCKSRPPRYQRRSLARYTSRCAPRLDRTTAIVRTRTSHVLLPPCPKMKTPPTLLSKTFHISGQIIHPHLMIYK